ncbi:unnamed protein product [Sphenostylis stenocarpa]|uniref:ferroxidase n=1 Tax=Sphenostylis stenocarpa TaxID=92480 RepID=A0AA86S7B5_9FABA|nr:unnamed protein product [Sphenostylis stenocarpa]
MGEAVELCREMENEVNGAAVPAYHHLRKASTPYLVGVRAAAGQLCHLQSQFQFQTEACECSSVLEEGEFHRLADSTIHSVQEKLEDYGDMVEVDGFDIDYGNDVLTVKLGDLGTYVLNKQTPNRQLWLSSPLSGPSRFDWDRDTKAWIYRRNKANLYKILEGELEQLCGKPIVLS